MYISELKKKVADKEQTPKAQNQVQQPQYAPQKQDNVLIVSDNIDDKNQVEEQDESTIEGEDDRNTEDDKLQVSSLPSDKPKKKFKRIGLFISFQRNRFNELKKENPSLGFKELHKILVDEYKNLTPTKLEQLRKNTDEFNQQRKEKFFGKQESPCPESRQTLIVQHKEPSPQVVTHKINLADKQASPRWSGYKVYLTIRKAEIQQEYKERYDEYLAN